MTDAPAKATKVNRLADVRVVADMGDVTRFIPYDDYTRIARALEAAVDEFNSFIRDHRSQDHVRLSVERTIQSQCSACGREWEEDDGKCAQCGAEVA